ncbi:hypothetical protein MMC13_001634, partial [Lambiella insularis]|nr:hypothetical protein [Lambiella insularis]
MADLVQISTVSEEDFEDIATIISRAMAADLIDFFQFGNNYEKAMEIKRTLCRNTFPNSLADPQTRIFKASLRENAKVVAFASVRFHTAEMPTGTESPSGFPPGMNQDFCALYYGAIGAKKQQHLA